MRQQGQVVRHPLEQGIGEEHIDRRRRLPCSHIGFHPRDATIASPRTVQHVRRGIHTDDGGVGPAFGERPCRRAAAAPQINDGVRMLSAHAGQEIDRRPRSELSKLFVDRRIPGTDWCVHANSLIAARATGCSCSSADELALGRGARAPHRRLTRRCWAPSPPHYTVQTGRGDNLIGLEPYRPDEVGFVPFCGTSPNPLCPDTGGRPVHTTASPTDRSTPIVRAIAFLAATAVAAGTLYAAPATAQAEDEPDPDPNSPEGVPSVISSLGDSISEGTGSTGDGQGGWIPGSTRPRNSWTTGDWDGLNSHAQRLEALGADVVREPRSENGARMATDAVNQAMALPTDVEYVTVQLGGNDLCRPNVEEMTSTEQYAAELDAALAWIDANRPEAVVGVSSVPDIYRLWEL